MIRLSASIGLQYMAGDASDFILNLQPVNNEHQSVLSERLTITPAVSMEEYQSGIECNRMLRFRGGPGPISISYECVVDIRHSLESPESIFETGPSAVPHDLLRYLLPSRYCESDMLMPFAVSQFGGLNPGYGRVQAISDWVGRNVRFTSGASIWTTSAKDTFLRREGVCRDFAHLMITLCRAVNIPARFVTGIDYGADPVLGPTDFHAFVEVYLGRRWYLFDPTGICPVNGLMRIGTGMDAADTSFATLFGQVQTAAPVISIAAIEDAGLGIVLPGRIPMAVSTSRANGEVQSRPQN